MEDCIFCKIIKGGLPSYKIYEDEYTYVFLDNAMKDYGHTLVIPKKHCINTIDCDSSILQKVILSVQKVAKHYVNSCGFSGVLITNANNESAGQVVGHLHYHIIPKGDSKNRSEKTPLQEQMDTLKLS